MSIQRNEVYPMNAISEAVANHYGIDLERVIQSANLEPDTAVHLESRIVVPLVEVMNTVSPNSHLPKQSETHSIEQGVKQTTHREKRMDSLNSPAHWKKKGLCVDVDDPDIFFKHGTRQEEKLMTEEAKAVCSACAAKIICLTWALETGEIFGVWGGLTPDERRAMKRRGRNT